MSRKILIPFEKEEINELIEILEGIEIFDSHDLVLIARILGNLRTFNV